MKDIINIREFQGDKGPDWPKTFHPRDVPNPSRSYCKICPLPIIQTLEHLVRTRVRQTEYSTVGSLCNNMGIPALQVSHGELKVAVLYPLNTLNVLKQMGCLH